MYIASGTSALLRRASHSSRAGGRAFYSSVSRKHPSPSPAFTGHQVQHQQHRSLGYLTAAARWSHGVEWKSPTSLTAQIRIAAAAASDSILHRKISTMGGCFFSFQYLYCDLGLIVDLFFFFLVLWRCLFLLFQFFGRIFDS